MLGIILLLPMFSLADISQWQVQDYWTKLEPRMTEQVVIELLGDPLEKEIHDSRQVWYYQQTPRREGDKIISRPRHGLLSFRKNDSTCLLYNWKEPDWTVTAPHTERQYLAEIQKIENQRKIEEAKLLQEEQRQARALQAEQAAIEREAQKQQQIARAEQRRQTTAVSRTRTEANRAGIPAAKPDTHTQFTSRYFITIGGAFVLIAFIIACTQGFRMFNK